LSQSKPMKKQYSIVLFLIFIIAGAVSISAQTVYMVCTWDTSSIFKGKDGRDKFERRFYVSNTVSMSKEDFLKADSEGDRLEGVCAEYLTDTVEKAAIDRGERLENGTITVIRNIELSGENLGSPNPYKFGTKEDVEKKRDADVKEMLDAGRFVLNFNWDVGRKNEAADYAAEKKRVLPTPAPPAKKP
jgi:hypothetical protein